MVTEYVSEPVDTTLYLNDRLSYAHTGPPFDAIVQLPDTLVVSGCPDVCVTTFSVPGAALADIVATPTNPIVLRLAAAANLNSR